MTGRPFSFNLLFIQGEHGDDGAFGLPGKAGSRGKTGVPGLPGDQGSIGPKVRGGSLQCFIMQSG